MCVFPSGMVISKSRSHDSPIESDSLYDMMTSTEISDLTSSEFQNVVIKSTRKFPNVPIVVNRLAFTFREKTLDDVYDEVY